MLYPPLLIKHKLHIEYASVLLYIVNLFGCILGTDHGIKRKGKFFYHFGVLMDTGNG